MRRACGTYVGLGALASVSVLLLEAGMRGDPLWVLLGATGAGFTFALGLALLARQLLRRPITLEARAAEAALAAPDPCEALARRLRDARVRPKGEHVRLLDGRWRGHPVSLRFERGGDVTCALPCEVPLFLTGKLQPRADTPSHLRPALEGEAGREARWLLRYSRHIDVGLRGLEVATTLDHPDDLERALGALVLLAAAVRSDPAPPPEPPPPEVRVVGARDAAAPEPADGPLRCPYCHAGLDEDAPDAITCAACATPHHAACFKEHGRCTVPGCAGREPARRRARS